MLKYQPELNSCINVHEHEMLAKYQTIVAAYESKFAIYGCTTECGLLWKIFPSDVSHFDRVHPCRGYSSYIYCIVKKDGIQVDIPSSDGEADYYPLICCWQVVSISSAPFHPYVSLFNSVEDSHADIEDFLSMLQAHYKV